MRKFIFIVTLAGTMVAAEGVAAADPPPNQHNCVGVADSSLAGPGFGALVGGIARSRAGAIADSLDPFANCGNTGPRQ
jgi:hypothetical protein